jgi:hypothetical protein
MTFTLSLSEILLLALTVVACVVAYTLVKALGNLNRATQEMSKTLEAVQGLTVRMQRLSDEAERTVVSVRRFSEEGYAVAGDLAATTHRVREVVEEGAVHLEKLFVPMRYLPLLAAGLKAGFEAYSRFRDQEPDADSPTDETPEGENP